MVGELRSPLVTVEPLSEDDSAVRSPLVTVEPLTEGPRNLRGAFVSLDPLTEGYRNLRVSLLLLESLHPVQPELPMSNDPFPGFGNSSSDPSVPAGADPFNSGLPGLSFSVHKKPMFRTKMSEAASGHEITNALMQYPKWEFNLTYEFLEDRTGSDSSLKTIMGFFLSRQGRFDSFLFKDPDDYIQVNGFCGNADGVTTEFPFCRTLGGFVEKVGQVDTANTINVYLSVTEASAVPANPGPYTVTVANAASFEEDLGVLKDGTTPMTKVVSGPVSGQYSVDEGTGTYTFAAADQLDTLAISYRYLVAPADYTVTLPNLFVFDSAPATGEVTADFQFFFACRFLEDQADYEKFMDKLWNLQECDFRSFPQ